MGFLHWLELTEFSVWMRESDWGYPIVLAAHSVGMGGLVGIHYLFCARVLGYIRVFPLAAYDKLWGIAWFGFVMNAASGTLLFIGEPVRLFLTWSFQLKMLSIVVAGFWFWKLIKALSSGERGPGPDGVSRGARIAAIWVLSAWTGAIIFGRLIGYTIEPPSPP